jgi:DNA-binding response OmpR family regulator
VDANITSQVQSIRDPAVALQDRDARIAAELSATCRGAAEELRSWRSQRHASAPPGAKRVLLVDDDRAILHALRRHLLDVVEFVDVAPSVAAAIKLAERNAYDLLVVDYHLTNGTARDVIRAVRDASMRPLVWAVLISGLIVDAEGRALAREVGANAWLAKPLSLEALHDAVHEGLAASQRARERVRNER